MEIITTQRLVLRPFKMSDLASFYDYARDPLVGPDAGWRPHESIEESRAVLKEIIRAQEAFALVRRQDKRLMGSIGLHADRKRQRLGCYMLGYVLGSPYWGLGYMTEAAQAMLHYAFNDLDAQMISIYHYPHNTRSMRVIEKCSFIYEGTLREASCLPDGSFIDELCYSLKSTEYFNSHIREPHPANLLAQPSGFVSTQPQYRSF